MTRRRRADMVVFDHLSFLEMFLMVVHKNGTPMPELYQMVQQAGNVLARLYLLITVGSVFIRSKKAPAKDILCDLVEMAKGVQHPLRGLFLRYYLSQKTKDKLPDLRSEYFGCVVVAPPLRGRYCHHDCQTQGGGSHVPCCRVTCDVLCRHGGTAEDAINFVLQNFTEMTRLWVRMQTSHAVRNRKRRERERQDLRVLVGSNLDRLSQMEGVDRAAYQKVAAPRGAHPAVDDRRRQRHVRVPWCDRRCCPTSWSKSATPTTRLRSSTSSRR